jgi:hypothetical protein
MSVQLQNAIDIIDDILSKVDSFAAQQAPAAGEAGAPGEQSKKGKKKDKKAKKEASAPPAAAAENEQSSDPFAMADLRVSVCFWADL